MKQRVEDVLYDFRHLCAKAYKLVVNARIESAGYDPETGCPLNKFIMPNRVLIEVIQYVIVLGPKTIVLTALKDEDGGPIIPESLWDTSKIFE